jgi:hypothetical protein
MSKRSDLGMIYCQWRVAKWPKRDPQLDVMLITVYRMIQHTRMTTKAGR